MGGIVLDIDTICLKPLDELVYKYSFFAGSEPSSINYISPTINFGLIGATPNHPIVNKEIFIIDSY